MEEGKSFIVIKPMYMNKETNNSLKDIDFIDLRAKLGAENFKKFLKANCNAILSEEQKHQLVLIENNMDAELDNMKTEIRRKITEYATGEDLVKYNKLFDQIRTIADAKSVRSILQKFIDDKRRNPGANKHINSLIAKLEEQERINFDFKEEKSQRSLKSVRTAKSKKAGEKAAFK